MEFDHQNEAQNTEELNLNHHQEHPVVEHKNEKTPEKNHNQTDNQLEESESQIQPKDHECFLPELIVDDVSVQKKENQHNPDPASFLKEFNDHICEQKKLKEEKCEPHEIATIHEHQQHRQVEDNHQLMDNQEENKRQHNDKPLVKENSQKGNNDDIQVKKPKNNAKKLDEREPSDRLKKQLEDKVKREQWEKDNPVVVIPKKARVSKSVDKKTTKLSLGKRNLMEFKAEHATNGDKDVHNKDNHENGKRKIHQNEKNSKGKIRSESKRGDSTKKDEKNIEKKDQKAKNKKNQSEETKKKPIREKSKNQKPMKKSVEKKRNGKSQSANKEKKEENENKRRKAIKNK